MRYVPQSIMVNVGQKIFHQSITDAQGKVAPQSSGPIYFAITGTAEGGRNDISPHNDFMVLLNRIDVPVSPKSSPPNSSPAQPHADSGLNGQVVGTNQSSALKVPSPTIGEATMTKTFSANQPEVKLTQPFVPLDSPLRPMFENAIRGGATSCSYSLQVECTPSHYQRIDIIHINYTGSQAEKTDFSNGIARTEGLNTTIAHVP